MTNAAYFRIQGDISTHRQFVVEGLLAVHIESPPEVDSAHSEEIQSLA